MNILDEIDLAFGDFYKKVRSNPSCSTKGIPSGAVTNALKKHPPIEKKPKVSFFDFERMSNTEVRTTIQRELGRKLPKDMSIKLKKLTSFTFEGDLYFKGKHIGKFAETFDYKTKEVFKAKLVINEKYRGKGYGSGFMKAEEVFYKDIGIKRIALNAADDGRFIWTHYGYQFENEGMRRVMLKEINKQYKIYQSELGITRDFKIFTHESQFIKDIDFFNSWEGQEIVALDHLIKGL